MRLTRTQLVSAIRAAAGDTELADLDGDVLDRRFDELGYDSLALLEVAAVLRRTHGIALPDDAVVELGTPADLLRIVNATTEEVR
ncbi:MULTISPECIES: acyl carrier protein [Saccharopolyspora]|uniref:Carrier domain-containing protein n=1 Tax=Saccharopolyspora gregorii TaxID=33914 RepID=A0ABP6RRE0_9PSEU|nr:MULTISPECIES: acyl carrier protein [unclassified Saccharopolyspora]MCA1187916.1 acyl carrier protein [Saccharopolyspora sp. 6T]MCA1195416.1 acyl carrier protein [Saccharopolyspora sp. 6V]MCA1226406.1 acyl carrier protein [Saccharopolyspora sp. 6M]MCA1279156.1 acyl carrier protein [Saccharopolyspora sp. 7B]